MNASRILLSFSAGAAVLIAVATAVHASCPGDGTNSAMVAEYLFVEGAGTNTVNTGIDEDDGNATLVHGAEFSADVPPPNDGCGWSVQFPSSGSGSTTPALEASAEYDPLAGASRFTLMAWVRRESGGAGSNTSARIVSDTSSLTLNTNTAGVEFRFSGSAGTLSLRVNGTEVGTAVGGIAPNSNAWHHMAVVYDGTRPATNAVTRNVHFYVDGIQRGDGNVLSGVVVGSNASRLTVGNSAVSRGVGSLLVGKIDDVLILYEYAPDAVGNGKTNETIRCYMQRGDDIELPQIQCPSDVVVQVAVGQCNTTDVALGQPVATDNCGVALVTNDAPASYPVGVTYVTWIATDYAGNQGSCTQRVTVLDTELPAITCPDDLVLEAGPCLAAVTNAVLGEPVVSDNCGVVGVVSIAPSEFVVGTNVVTWRVWDAAGNTNSCAQQVVVHPNMTADCDGDGLTDWEEVNIYFTDPANPSTADDGLSDGWKVQYGLNPTNVVPVECRPTYW
ncbi:MAG TPA: HYR domain-containing protein [Kiritimatiellia bacterium]|nr:HYR domain-containing protein [Kiritimatiellia bacterium]